MLAAIPVESDIMKYAEDNVPDYKHLAGVAVITDNASVIGEHATAIKGLTREAIIDELNQRDGVPAGFSRYDIEECSTWRGYHGQDPIYKKLSAKADKLFKPKTNGTNSDGYFRFHFVRKLPAMVLTRDKQNGNKFVVPGGVNDVLLMAQARLCPSGIYLPRDFDISVFKLKFDTLNGVRKNRYSGNNAQIGKEHIESGRPVIINDEYMLIRDPLGIRMVYAPDRITTLRKRRASNVVGRSKSKLTAFQCLTNIIRVFCLRCWCDVGLNNLAISKYRTHSLMLCGRTILNYTEYAHKIGRFGICRRQFKKYVRQAWHHRNMLSSKCDPRFKEWFARELRIAGKPPEAAVLEAEEKRRLKRRLERAKKIQARIAKAEHEVIQTVGQVGRQGV